jgi:ubiquinone/menaquinone biosynthesis methyltransferase
VTSPVRPERLFAPLGPTYERAGALLSLGLERGWRQRLIERAAPRDGDVYLDVATGTGLVARELRARSACRVVGIDLTREMLAAADRSDGIRFVQGRAEQLPFPDARFDGLTVTYLLRYVDDPAATLRELARVVRPGGRIAMLEFARPTSLPLRLGWWLYTRIALPMLGSLLSRDWREVGTFLGRSIDRFYDQHDMNEVWRHAGIDQVRTDRLGLGSAVVVSGRVSNGEAVGREAGRGRGEPPLLRGRVGASRQEQGADRSAPESARAQEGRDPRQRRPAERPTLPAFYALAPGGWRDYVTLLHPPYTLWHLSYVVLGAALASEVRLDRLAGTLVAFFLALGIGVHALDEMNGRPLQTRIPDRVLAALAILGLGAAVALGLAATPIVGAGLLLFIATGTALALGYPLELARGRLHSDLWFALGWGAFPLLTAAYASGGSITAAAIAGAAYAAALSHAQRRLSTWVRSLRRRADSVSGEIRMRDGATIALDRERLIDAPEAGLRWLTAVAALVAIAALAVRLG